MVLPDGEAVAGFDAFRGNAGTNYFGQSIQVQRHNAEAPLQFSLHALGPGFGAEDAHARRGLGGVESLAHEFVRDYQKIRRRAHNDVGLEVTDKPDLTLGHAAARWNDRRAERFGAVVS